MNGVPSSLTRLPYLSMNSPFSLINRPSLSTNLPSESVNLPSLFTYLSSSLTNLCSSKNLFSGSFFSQSLSVWEIISNKAFAASAAYGSVLFDL